MDMERDNLGRPEAQLARGRDRILCYISMRSPGTTEATRGPRGGALQGRQGAVKGAPWSYWGGVDSFYGHPWFRLLTVIWRKQD